MLISMARNEIIKYLNEGCKPGPGPNEIPDSLKTKCGVFVSLYVEDKLRGCIGTFSEGDPLHHNVKKMALSAAFHDTRFSPLRIDETDKLKIEINVLSPRKLISGPDEIEIGRDGIYIEYGMNRGTFLPQVAVKEQWNAEEFLGNCAQYKAGLDWDAWRLAKLYTYETMVFDSDISCDDY